MAGAHLACSLSDCPAHGHLGWGAQLCPVALRDAGCPPAPIPSPTARPLPDHPLSHWLLCGPLHKKNAGTYVVAVQPSPDFRASLKGAASALHSPFLLQTHSWSSWSRASVRLGLSWGGPSGHPFSPDCLPTGSSGPVPPLTSSLGPLDWPPWPGLPAEVTYSLPPGHSCPRLGLGLPAVLLKGPSGPARPRLSFEGRGPAPFLQQGTEKAKPAS